MLWEISGQICFSGQAQVAQKYWMQKYIQSSETFQGTLRFSGQEQVAQNFWMINNIYIFTVKTFRAHSIFLGKHKLLKNPECENYIQ